MLKQVLVGNSGLRSSQIALGTMTFGEGRDWGCSADEAMDILSRFVEAGGTTIDTAPNYANGGSEKIIGRFASGKRDELVLSTKYTASSTKTPLAGGNSRRSMVQSVEASLKRLDTDRIDLLWLHFWDFTTPLDEILRAADDLTRAGKILYFGLSDTPAWLASRAVTIAELRNLAPVVAIQLEYNVASRGVETDLLPMAENLGLSAFCWAPLAAGALTDGTARKRNSGKRLPSYVQTARDGLASIAAKTGIASHHLALLWLLGSGRNLIPIVGARTSDQLTEMVQAISASLDAEIIDEISGLATPKLPFPTKLIESDYLRTFALGTPERYDKPWPSRC